MAKLKREITGPRVQTLLFFFLVFIVSYQFIKPRKSSKDIEIVGNRAYLASGSAGIDILDISDPGNPISIGSYDTQGSANQIAISEDYLFVADGSDGLLILDISDPANVHQIGKFDTPGNAEDVAFKGKEYINR